MRFGRRLLSAGVALALLVGSATGGQPAGPTADQKVKDLMAKYNALSSQAQGGPEGNRVVEQIGAVKGNVSPETAEAAARLVSAHNLRQLALAAPGRNEPAKAPGQSPPKPVPPGADPGLGPDWQKMLLPYIEPSQFYPPPAQPRSRWEYRVEDEARLSEGKEGVAGALNRLGADGWELVAVDKGRYFLKRPK
jgi:hypothetical protein